MRKPKFVILVQISRVLVNISKIFVEISEILVKNLKHNCQNLKVVKISKCFSYIIKGFCQNSGFFGLYLDGFYQIFKSLDKSLGYWLKVQRIWSNSQMCWKISKHTGHYLTALWSKSQKTRSTSERFLSKLSMVLFNSTVTRVKSLTFRLQITKNFGQNILHFGQNVTNFSQNLIQFGQNLIQFGWNLKNFRRNL